MKTIYTSETQGKMSKDRWIERLRKLQKTDTENWFASAYFDEDTETMYHELVQDFLKED